MGERLTPEQAAEQVKEGDQLLLTVRGTARAFAGSTRYVITKGGLTGKGLYLDDEAIESVELLPPVPQPGEWWLVRQGDGPPHVMLRLDHGWGFHEDTPHRYGVTPLRKMTFADSAG